MATRLNFKSTSQKSDFIKDHPDLAKSMGVFKSTKNNRKVGAISRRLKRK